MQAADARQGDDLARARWVYLAGFGSVLGQRQVSPAMGIIAEVIGEDTAQVALTEDDAVVEAVSAYGADQTFGKRVLPGRAGRGEHFMKVKIGGTALKCRAVDTVGTAQQVPGWGIPRECLHELLSGPRGAWVVGDVEVDDFAPLMAQNGKDEEHPEGRRGTVKKSMATKSLRWLSRKVHQV